MKSIYVAIFGFSLVAPLSAHALPQANEFRQSYPTSTINTQIQQDNQMNSQAQRAQHGAARQG